MFISCKTSGLDLRSMGLFEELGGHDKRSGPQECGLWNLFFPDTHNLNFGGKVWIISL